MQIKDGHLIASPSDLSSQLSCRRKLVLDLGVATRALQKPDWRSPVGAALAKRGAAHEADYVGRLRALGLDIVDLSAESDVVETQAAMSQGREVIVQAPMAMPGWSGRADVLRKVAEPSPNLGAWSYEVEDTKLARETKSGTILQMCLYTEVVGVIQGRMPAEFSVVTPARTERYRFDDFGAYYRLQKRRLEETIGARLGEAPPEFVAPTGVPNPVEHCELCRWFERCNRERRAADHLSFVANLGTMQQGELSGRAIDTMERLSVEPVPLAWKPDRGAKATYERLVDQADLQVERRKTGALTVRRLPIQADQGLCKLSEPSPHDVFLDLEGDPFARPGGGSASGDTSREYLFGLGRVVDGEFFYEHRWAMNDAEEKAAFEWAMDMIRQAIATDASAHVYHYAPYEPAAFRRLASRHATREPELDVLLRESRFVDLYSVVRNAVRVGVESYSIKKLEDYYEFTRDIALSVAGDERQIVEVALETGDYSALTESVKGNVVGYNKDDCRSTLHLRTWLEKIRDEAVASGGQVPRPGEKKSEESGATEEDQRAAELRARLLDGLPDESSDRSPKQQATWLMANLLEWHRREERVAWGEYHRLREKPVEDLYDEAGALVGLKVVRRLPKAPKERNVTDLYEFPEQAVELDEGDSLCAPDNTRIGSVSAIDRNARTIAIKKTKDTADVHPPVVIEFPTVPPPQVKESVFGVAHAVAEVGLDHETSDPVVRTLLLRTAPRLLGEPFSCPSDSATDYAISSASRLDCSVLPIQGPPGAGKTFTGAMIIRALVKQGRTVGVVANSHKVITNLLDDVIAQARKAGEVVRVGQKGKDGEPIAAGAMEFKRSQDAVAALAAGGVHVLGGTAWLWATAGKCVDVLVVDEAGQMSLANVVGVAPAAHSLVLLGDPRQLQQPKKGSHPEGCDVSALEHLIGSDGVVSADRGILLPTTWRMAPSITRFTSTAFYQNRLSSKPGLERQRLNDAGEFDGNGLHVMEIPHTGNQNYSEEEVDAVQALVHQLLGGATWTNEDGETKPLQAGDVLVVAPYNAQVTRLRERLDDLGVPVGTVDKFQGQEAPVVIYSMASSSAADAPRGMDFLFSLNRLNVGTSRARCVAIIVASPALLGPECKTPRHMKLANALCLFSEIANGDA